MAREGRSLLLELPPARAASERPLPHQVDPRRTGLQVGAPAVARNVPAAATAAVVSTANGSAAAPHKLVFGPFHLLPSERLLLECGRPVRLGGRAIELLATLIDQAGKVVTKEQLLASVWPKAVVEDSSLRVHIAALRKALGEGANGLRYIANVPGRGYTFVAEVRKVDRLPADPPMQPSPTTFPVSLTSTIGLHSTVRSLVRLVADHRLVTIVAAGGFGKTTAARAAAEAILADAQCETSFVDLTRVRDLPTLSELVSATIGLDSDAVDPAAAVAHGLRGRRLLLVLDNCEHVVHAAAECAVRLLKAAPSLRILATSREPLRAEGEMLFALAPLAVPPAGRPLDCAEEALRFPATQLLVTRIAATIDAFELRDADAEVASELCRRLDGMPLAIELAAARVRFFGLRGLLSQLDGGLRILACGQRTTPSRHRSLRSLLDSSFDALDPLARVAFMRLAAFDGAFSLADAIAVAGDDVLCPEDVVEAVIELALKSLVVADFDPSVVAYRLLGTTRTYALEKLTASGELAAIRERHAGLAGSA